MNSLTVLLIALSGGAGAAARFVVDTIITAHTSKRLPFGTLLVNVSGSFAIGLVVGLSSHHLLSPDTQAIVATGFLGGYTTFSTASTQTVDLLSRKRYGPAVLFAGGMFLVALLACAAGLLIAGSAAG